MTAPDPLIVAIEATIEAVEMRMLDRDHGTVSVPGRMVDETTAEISLRPGWPSVTQVAFEVANELAAATPLDSELRWEMRPDIFQHYVRCTAKTLITKQREADRLARPTTNQENDR